MEGTAEKKKRKRDQTKTRWCIERESGGGWVTKNQSRVPAGGGTRRKDSKDTWTEACSYLCLSARACYYQSAGSVKRISRAAYKALDQHGVLAGSNTR
jgi:hypothetical protein